ncbi:MAG TPA: GNAT family N-acetyltransferase [Anaeromyxobacteraceae bacterium]|nr:GNAT family N-acetyltransferase [Anaeromyxobacteraceae bacterium]
MTAPDMDALNAMSGPRLRALAARGSDAAQVQACFEDAQDYFVLTEGKLPAKDAAIHLLADAEVDDHRRVFLLVSHSGGPAVGVLDLYLDYPEPFSAQIGLLLLRESCRGLGYGKETTAALEAALVSAGYRALRLSVIEKNVGARAFWDRLGFATVGHLDGGATLYEKVLRRSR